MSPWSLWGLVCLALAARVDGFAPWRSAVRRSHMQVQMKVAAGTFVERVDAALRAKYPETQISRVLDAWDRLSKEEEVTNVLDASHPLMKQKATSFLSNIPVTLFHDEKHKQFKSWTNKLEKSWKDVAQELAAALADPDRLEKEGSNVWVGPLAGNEVAEAYGVEWKTLGLFDRCNWDEENVELFPKTSQLLVESGVPMVEAFFARMAPGSSIKPHSDNTNFVLTVHLGVDVPEGQCWIAVGNERREWKNGKVMVFDTSVLHEAANEADVDRYILMLRIWHPDVSKAERAALQFIFDAISDTDLVDDPQTVAMYDELFDQRARYNKALIADAHNARAFAEQIQREPDPSGFGR